jgi:LysM repeat protein
MLARQYKITLDSLMKANPTLDPYSLKIGMQLCIPVSGSSNGSDQAMPTIANPPQERQGNDNWNDRDNNDNRDNWDNRDNRGRWGNRCPNGRRYRTQRGDTLTRILDRFEITFAAIQSSNPNVDFTDSLENMVLCIPSEDPYRTCPMSGAYLVRNGDTLNSISKKLLVMTDSLLMANPTLTVEDFSIPATKVCIPG